MEDIYDILKELKSVSDITTDTKVKTKINEIYKALLDIQEKIYDSLNSVDSYGDPNEIGQIVYDIMEIIDYDRCH